jgi:hypothetical protein
MKNRKMKLLKTKKLETAKVTRARSDADNALHKV